MKLFAFGLGVCAIAAIVGFYFAGIDVAGLRPLSGSVTYSDRSDAALGTVLGDGSTHAVSVPLASISPAFLNAILAAEDARFWHHGPVDVPALLRAAREFAIYGEARSGGSTIEMQLARLIASSPDDSAQGDIRAKLAQIVAAERIAIVSSKSEILEAYVNRMPMGGNLYGVEAAARTYFGEPASDLDLAQASLLAAIPNDPTRLAPDSKLNLLRSRQHFILGRMVSLGEITRSAADRAFAETLTVRRHDFGIADAPQALFYLQRFSGKAGGRVRTTLDRNLQRFVQAQTEAVVAALQSYHVTDGAALVADNRTGEVLAYAGSTDYFADSVLGRNDGVQALRQPGSSLKPFTYELALERGAIASTTILADVPAAYAITSGALYQPSDYSGSFSGPVRVRYALANSLNAPAVQVLSKVGVGTFLARLHDLGFAHLNRTASYYGLGLTLGSGEVTLWELVQAYSTLARSGTFIPLHLLPDADAASRSIGDPGDWELITNMLADPYARAKSFGVGSVLQMPFPAAVKTGTSSDFRDTWAIGFTRDYTVGVWVGNFDGSPMRGVSGVTGAGPLWNRIMLHLYDRTEDPPPFSRPRGFVRTRICATTGRAPAPAERDCPAAVMEWVLPRDLAAIKRPTASYGRQYDPWLAIHPESVAEGLRIVFPHDGDVFVRNAPANTLEAREQELALRAVSPRGRVRWSVEGLPVPLDADGQAFWPVRVGTWSIEASDGLRRDRVTIRVVPPRFARPGFSRLTTR